MSTVSAPGAAALRELVLPVVIVAARAGDATSCATTTTTYVSLSPPIVSVPLRAASRTAQLAVSAGEFSVSVLTAGQAALAERAGRPSSARDKPARDKPARDKPDNDGAGRDEPANDGAGRDEPAKHGAARDRPANDWAARDKLADAGITPEPPPAGRVAPGVAGPGAVLWCTVSNVVTAGDHLVLFGEVAAFRAGAGDSALLLRHQRRYLASGADVPDAAPDGYPI